MGSTRTFPRGFEPWRVEARRAAEDVAAQWLWFAAGISPDRVGWGCGPLNWGRALRHRLVVRKLHICLLTCTNDRMQFGPLTAWAINERSRLCSASINDGLERADVVWIYAQDPMSPECRADFESRLRTRARPDVRVINPPSSYNGYHQAQTFDYLSRNGISVPRIAFSDADVGVTRVVYKELGRQAAPKRNVTYTGPKPGMSAFEFIDSAKADGLYRRYRAHYFLGHVRPSEVLLSDHWNVCMRNSSVVQYGFRLTRDESDQIERIAKLLGLDYFAIDFVRRASDDRAFFTDVNVYPTVRSPRELVRRRGDFGKWHTFDACARLGIDEPLGGEFWGHFDDAMMQFAAVRPTVSGHLGNSRHANAPSGAAAA